jgi:hypothetical protein
METRPDPADVALEARVLGSGVTRVLHTQQSTPHVEFVKAILLIGHAPCHSLRSMTNHPSDQNESKPVHTTGCDACRVLAQLAERVYNRPLPTFPWLQDLRESLRAETSPTWR